MPDEQQMIEALQRIVDWSGAYSTRFFPAPGVDDWRRAHEALAAAGLSLDRLAADCMRHVAEGMGKIAREALRDV